MKLNEKQMAMVDAQIKRLIKTDSYYGKMYRDAGIDGVSSQEDFEKLPFSSKADLRYAYPLGIQAVPDEEVEEGEKLHRVEAVLGARFPGINQGR